MQIVHADLSFNNGQYTLAFPSNAPQGTAYEWCELSGTTLTSLSNSQTYDLSNNYLYIDGDVLRTFVGSIDSIPVIKYYILYKSYFRTYIQYPINFIGNPIKIDISYSSYALDASQSIILSAGNITGGREPYQFQWYQGAQLLVGEISSNLLVVHNLNNIEPQSHIDRSYYCYIFNAGNQIVSVIARFDVTFNYIPLPLNATQNLLSKTLDVNESTSLILTIVGGKKPLTIVWEKKYPTTDFLSIKTNSSFTETTETLNIANVREFPINEGVLLYRATITDIGGESIQFTFTITCKGYYLSEPCIPQGTEVLAYNELNQLLPIPIENIQIGQFILSNRNTKVRVKDIIKRTITINDNMHILSGGVALFKDAIISNDAYLYNYVNNLDPTFNGQTIDLYQLETPNYVNYDIIIGTLYVKSYGNHEASLAYSDVINAYTTIIPLIDNIYEEPGDVLSA
jgi:hypothetical protein